MEVKVYTPRELMELALIEMEKSRPEHSDRTDPKVGAVLATSEGILIDKGHRGELRQGDHAEFTILERKNRTKNLENTVLYATLEPCAPGARSITKLGCAERIFNARVKKVYVGIEDPDPKVRGNGIAYLKSKKIEIEFFDKDLQERIFSSNEAFLNEAAERARIADLEEVESVFSPLDESLSNYDMTDFSEEALGKFKEKIKISYEVNSDEFKSIMKKWNFIKVDTKSKTIIPTGLGILLFGKHAQIAFPQSLIKFTIKTKNEKAKILDFDGPLVLMPEKIESYLEINFPKSIDRSSFARKEEQEVYFEVLREVIINAIVHRDYTIEGANINIKNDIDKLIVESPGKPVVPMDKLKNFTAPTFSTNPKIANVFYQMGFIEKRNLGMEELHQFATMMGLRKPVIDYNEPYLRITIWKNSKGKSEPTVEELQEYIILKGEVSSVEVATNFGLNPKTASRYLNKLVEDGIITMKGQFKGRRYLI